MGDVNQKLLDFFSTNYKSGVIALVGTNDPIGLAIREAQSPMTKDGKSSLWSHCFLLGDLRFDRGGLGGAKVKSPYIFESDLKVDIFEPQVRNGAQENWIGKWCASKVENASLIDYQLSSGETEMVLATALQLVDEQVLYPIQGLLGTWWAIVMKKQWAPNPLNSPHAMYCSSFVRYCYQQAGRDFIGNEIDVSNTAPENIAQAGIGANAMKIFS